MHFFNLMASTPAMPQEAQHIIIFRSDPSTPLIIKISAAEHTEDDKDNIAALIPPTIDWATLGE